MVANPLVEDLERGADLVVALKNSGFRVEFATWSYSGDDDEWRLIIATPETDEHGRLAAYERIRAVLENDPQLDPGLGRIVLVSPEDPDLKGLRSIAQRPDVEDTTRSSDRAVVRGRPIDASYVYSALGLQYEHDVWAALQRLAPQDAVLRRGERVFENGHEVDFVVDDGRGPVVIEVKAWPRPVDRSTVTRMRAVVPEAWPLLYVSRSGFTGVSTETSPRTILATWSEESDDEALRKALTDAFSARAA